MATASRYFFGRTFGLSEVFNNKNKHLATFQMVLSSEHLIRHTGFFGKWQREKVRLIFGGFDSLLKIKIL